MHVFIFILALFLLIIGLTFFYRPTWIVRFNRIARERIFNDTIILLERRKKGIFFILLSFIFFYWSYYLAQYARTHFSEKIVSTDRLLYQSFQHLQLRQYPNVKLLCDRVLARDPNNAEALYQLGAVQFLLNDPNGAQELWLKAEKADPAFPDVQRYKDLVAHLREPASIPAQ